jgi:hypothetical protein
MANKKWMKVEGQVQDSLYLCYQSSEVVKGATADKKTIGENIAESLACFSGIIDAANALKPLLDKVKAYHFTGIADDKDSRKTASNRVVAACQLAARACKLAFPDADRQVKFATHKTQGCKWDFIEPTSTTDRLAAMLQKAFPAVDSTTISATIGTLTTMQESAVAGRAEYLASIAEQARTEALRVRAGEINAMLNKVNGMANSRNLEPLAVAGLLHDANQMDSVIYGGVVNALSQ